MTVLLWPFLLMVAFLVIGTVAVMFGGLVLERYEHVGVPLFFALAGVVLLGAAFLMGVVAFGYEIVPVHSEVAQ